MGERTGMLRRVSSRKSRVERRGTSGRPAAAHHGHDARLLLLDGWIFLMIWGYFCHTSPPLPPRAHFYFSAPTGVVFRFYTSSDSTAVGAKEPFFNGFELAGDQSRSGRKLETEEVQNLKTTPVLSRLLQYVIGTDEPSIQRRSATRRS